MKKVSKAILIGFAVLAALGIALVVGLNLYIQSPGSQARIQEELSKSLRLPLKLTNVSVSPFSTLRITGITIPNGGANFLEAASFNARYRLLPLLHGRLIITEMNVQNPKVVWVQTADGKWKFPGPEEAGKVAAADATQTLPKAGEQTPKMEVEKAAGEKKSNFAVIVERFDVKGGDVELLDSAKKHVAVFTDVNMTYTSLTAENVEGTATIGKVVWADSLTLENVRTPFKYSDDTFTLSEITAAFAGGTVAAKYHSHAEKDSSPFKVAITLKNKVDLDRLSTQLGSPAGETVGLLTGQVEWHGDGQTDHSQGEGHLDLRDAQFHQLDLFQNIGQILGMRELSDLRVRDGHVDLRLTGDKILVDKFLLNTSDLQLAAHGTAHLDKRVNLSAQLSAEDAVVQRLPGMIRDSFGESTGGRRAIDFAITGNADKPKTNLLDRLMGQKIDAQLGDVLNTIFGGEKKPEDDKSKKEDKKPDKDRKKKDKEKAAAQAGRPGDSANLTGPGDPGHSRNSTHSRRSDDASPASASTCGGQPVRVIAGKARGRALHVPKSDLRPTMDRVKAAIFSSLGEGIVGARLLDLFAGTGSLGIEALSRGASSVVFVENDRLAVAAIERNLEKTQLRGDVQPMDVFRFLDRFASTGSFHLIIADPPYAKAPGERDFTPELLASEPLRQALVPEGLFILEHLPGAKLPLRDAWECIRQKRYGATEVAFLRRLH